MEHRDTGHAPPNPWPARARLQSGALPTVFVLSCLFVQRSGRLTDHLLRAGPLSAGPQRVRIRVLYRLGHAQLRKLDRGALLAMYTHTAYAGQGIRTM